MRTKLERILEIMYTPNPFIKYPSVGQYGSIPGEILTIIRSRYSRMGGTVKSDKRSMYGAQHVYHLGIAGPNFPLPCQIETGN